MDADFTKPCKDHANYKSKIDALASATDGQDVMNIYDSWAATYEQDMELESSGDAQPNRVIDSVAEVFRDNKDAIILDAAAGTGLGGKLMFEHGFRHIDALDMSKNMLEKAKKRGVYKNFICDKMGANKLQIPDDHYDAVVLMGAFGGNHVQTDFFPELIRILKPGGFFFVDVCDLFAHDHDAFEKEKRWKIVKRESMGNVFDDFERFLLVFQVI